MPAKRVGRPLGARTRIALTLAGEAGAALEGTVGQFGALSVEPVEESAAHAWRVQVRSEARADPLIVVCQACSVELECPGFTARCWSGR